MPVVPMIRTPETAASIRAALANRGLSNRQVDFLTAHILIETSRGQNVFQHNVGNIAVTRSTQRAGVVPFWRPPWFAPAPDASDRTKQLHEDMLRNQAPSAFAAYASLGDGVDGYLEFLHRDRFRPMLDARTPQQFVQAWRDTGYSPRLNVRATLPNFRGLLQHRPSGHGLLIVGLLLAGGAGLWYLRRRGYSLPRFGFGAG
jgi:hypothetical protein